MADSTGELHKIEVPGAVRDRMAVRMEWEAMRERVDSGVHLGRCQPEGSPGVELKATP